MGLYSRKKEIRKKPKTKAKVLGKSLYIKLEKEAR